MFSKKKDNARKTEGGKALMAQMGFLEGNNDDNDEDAELEAELRALQGLGDSPVHRKKQGKLLPQHELNNMIQMSMKEFEDDEEEVSDTEDPELLAELAGLESDDESIDAAKSSSASSSSSYIPTLQDRLLNYKAAFQHAKSVNDAVKLKRFERGIKTIEDLLSETKCGKAIKDEDIPPQISIPSSTPKNPTIQNTQPTANAASSSDSQSINNSQSTINTSQNVILNNTSQNVFNNNQNLPFNPDPTLNKVVQIPLINKSSGAVISSPNIENTSIYKPTPFVNPVINTQAQQITAPTKIFNQHSQNNELLLTNRREEYKLAALSMKASGNNAKALEFMKIVKQMDALLCNVKEGKPIDSAQIPPPISSTIATNSTMETAQLKKLEEEIPPMTNEEKNKLYKVPESSGNVMQALEQRLLKYKESEDQAKQEDNSGKAKRMGRIVKQYEDAIKLHKAGKPFDSAELPNPPGFPPLPVNAPAVQTPASPQSTKSPSAVANTPASNDLIKKPNAQKPNLQKQMSMYSRSEQQANFLLTRQAKFKQAALDAKNKGDIELAKKYIRLAKGFDQMIEASRNGLPVDLSQIPTPPGSGDDSGFVFVEKSDVQQVGADAQATYTTLQDDLLKQIKMCESNRNHFTKLGDVSSASRFDKMGDSTRKDLDALKNAYDHGDPVPRFHYETRQFSLVKCCTELGDNDLELTILRGVNYNPPAGYTSADMHTYVKYEFPFPEAPQVGETAVIKATLNPEYNQTFKLEVNRKSRSFLRLLKSSKTFKFDVYYKRGFLKGDKLLGSVNLKLQSLEEKCIIHECADLVENRKAVGGKLEVRWRVRDPFVSKQVEQMTEKWLVIDQFIRKPPNQNEVNPPANVKAKAAAKPTLGSKVQKLPDCVGVLKFEKDELDQKILKFEKNLKPQELEHLRNKSKFLFKKIEETSQCIVKDGQKSMLVYFDGLKKLKNIYMEEAKTSAGNNNIENTRIILMKQKLVQKEIESLSAKLNIK